MNNKISSKFKFISENTIKIVNEMLSNQNLVKYIHYLDREHPLNSDRPDVSAREVRDKNFVFTHFNEDILVETQILVFVNPNRGRFPSNRVVAGDIYRMDIIIPNRYWMIGDTLELRAFSIAHEIALEIDNKNIAGVGSVIITDWDSYKVNDKYSGLTLLIEVSNVAVKSGI